MEYSHMRGTEIPEKLKAAIEADLDSVSPLPAPWRRSLVVGIVIVVLASVVFAFFGLRKDVAELPSWVSWGCTIIGFLIGFVLAGLALREAVPGDALPIGTVVSAVVAGIGFHLLVGFATWHYHPVGVGLPESFANGGACFAHELLLAIPAFAATLWLISRALPTRGAAAGALGAAGAAITADSITHMQCSISDPFHLLVWHTGAIVVFIILGAVIGKLWQSRR